VRDNLPKVYPAYKILAYLDKSGEPKSVSEISKGIGAHYHTVRFNVLKLSALGVIESKDGKYVINEKGRLLLDEFFKEVDELKKTVKPGGQIH